MGLKVALPIGRAGRGGGVVSPGALGDDGTGALDPEVSFGWSEGVIGTLGERTLRLPTFANI